jgi:hypothetical protein
VDRLVQCRKMDDILGPVGRQSIDRRGNLNEPQGNRREKLKIMSCPGPRYFTDCRSRRHVMIHVLAALAIEFCLLDGKC